MSPRTTIVVPTVGRPSLDVLLHALARGSTPLTAPVVVVDDRSSATPLEATTLELPSTGFDVTVVHSGGGGPARARNLGWRRARTPWVSFLDDDVVPSPDWYADLLVDLAGAAPGVAGSQGTVVVPLPEDRRPTDWERGTAGLESALWITADMSYRRDALARVGGFDERFPRAFREDADLGLRITGSHGEIVRGSRRVGHPARPADGWASVRQQRGNADDFLMRALHGADWHERVAASPGRRRRHLAIAAAGATALVAAVARRPRVAALAGAAWLAGTAELAAARISPGPRDTTEVGRMLLTSLVIPFAATWHSACGLLRHRNARPWSGLPDLVLFDRDGTLVHDVPYNGDPGLVQPVDGARAALDRLRGVGVPVGMVTNQSGVASGRIGSEQLAAVQARVDALLGPFDVVEVCPHGPDDECGCRKPEPGMVTSACGRSGARADRCVVVGDTGSDVMAAEAAGAVGILVPNPATRQNEVDRAERVSPSLAAAVDDILGGRW
ncbi:MAG: HAD-IIIA family hydrolase [Marmoricola sp.]